MQYPSTYNSICGFRNKMQHLVDDDRFSHTLKLVFPHINESRGINNGRGEIEDHGC